MEDCTFDKASMPKEGFRPTNIVVVAFEIGLLVE